MGGVDHPRSRGVYTCKIVLRINEQRIIPARAGFTPRSPRTLPFAGDHPRSRGVYATCVTPAPTSVGSSPLARGLRFPWPAVWVRTRIIPARAGFTEFRTTGAGRRTDHPRSRGVYLRISRRLTLPVGSSPLARGLPNHGGATAGRARIIPARAGFTSTASARRPSNQDHPRSRGVYAAPTARAPLSGDHPRSRGVYGERRPGDFGLDGSSPLARGLLSPKVPVIDRLRIIPARAGFTTWHFAPQAWARDHPRSRGVYFEIDMLHARHPGSSPLARGLRCHYCS